MSCRALPTRAKLSRRRAARTSNSCKTCFGKLRLTDFQHHGRKAMPICVAPKCELRRRSAPTLRALAPLTRLVGRRCRDDGTPCRVDVTLSPARAAPPLQKARLSAASPALSALGTCHRTSRRIMPTRLHGQRDSGRLLLLRGPGAALEAPNATPTRSDDRCGSTFAGPCAEPHAECATLARNPLHHQINTAVTQTAERALRYARAIAQTRPQVAPPVSVTRRDLQFHKFRRRRGPSPASNKSSETGNLGDAVTQLPKLISHPPATSRSRTATTILGVAHSEYFSMDMSSVVMARSPFATCPSRAERHLSDGGSERRLKGHGKRQANTELQHGCAPASAARTLKQGCV